MVVEVDVEGAENRVVVVLLDADEVCLQMRLVKIMDERDGVGDFIGIRFLAMLGKLLPMQDSGMG